ncbi:MAG: substrate-binding domain-containing protein [Lachnospiraceae bacterium]|nr:substrate-binding domain-containing protein [Lachnospiraceae bacterium]
MKKMWNRRVSGLALAVLVLLSTGCGKQEEAPVAEVESKAETVVEMNGKKVGISLPSEESAIWRRDAEYLKESFYRQGYETEILYCGNSAARQGEDVKRLLANDCDLLIAAPVDPDTLGNSLVKQAVPESGEELPEDEQEAPLPPVLSLGSLIRNTNKVTCAVIADQYQIGVLQAKAVIDGLGVKLDDAGKVYNIELAAGNPDDAASGFIFNGAYDTLKPYLDVGAIRIPSGQVTFSETCTRGGTSESAEERMKAVLNEHYTGKTQLDAVLGGTDTVALGIGNAIDSEYSGRNRVLVTGSGADEAALARIIDGKQKMTVFTAVCEEAAAACDIGISLMNDEYTDSSIIERSKWDFDCKYDTTNYANGSKIVRSFLLEPVSVTADNFREVLVDSGYYQMDGKYPKLIS